MDHVRRLFAGESSVPALAFDLSTSADYHETCASKPGDRCPALAPAAGPRGFADGQQGRGRGKSELRRAVCSLTARVEGGCLPSGWAVRLRYGKCHRKHTAWFSPGQPGSRAGKGEKVRSRGIGN